MTWTKLLIAIAVFQNVNAENEDGDIALVQTKMEDSLELDQPVAPPYLCIAAMGMCWYPCNILTTTDCDGCNALMCPHVAPGTTTPAPTPGPTLRAPAQCLYKGGMLGQNNGLHGSRLGCANDVTIGTGVSKEECLIDGQAHNARHISYNAQTQVCKAVPANERCQTRVGRNNFHYFDCEHRCPLINPSRCVFVDDSGVVTGQRGDGNKPRAEAKGVDAEMCLLICENVAAVNGNPNNGCCQWNQKQNNCRFFETTPTNTGTLKTGGNKNKWSVELATCA